MKDFNEYVENSKNTKKNDSANKNDIFGLANSLANKFDGKSQNELLAAIYKEAKSGKEKGTLSDNDIDNFVATISPFLNDKKRNYLNKIAKDLKNI